MVKAKKANKQHSNANPSTSDEKSSEKKDVTVDRIVTGAGPSTECRQSSGDHTKEEDNTKLGDLHAVPKSDLLPRKRKSNDESEVENAPSKKRRKGKKGKQPSESHQPSQQTVRKLAPSRPFPTVPTSVSATGPRSAHTEGKNLICITRKTELGMYLRRCKEVVVKDGYKTLHLHAMGAAIPHLARLAVSLPSILPFPPSDIQTEVRTGTTEVQDEIIPNDEDEDISLRTRGKSTMSVVIKIQGGDEDKSMEPTRKKKKSINKAKGVQSGGLDGKGAKKDEPEQLVYTENDLEDDGE